MQKCNATHTLLIFCGGTLHNKTCCNMRAYRQDPNVISGTACTHAPSVVIWLESDTPVAAFMPIATTEILLSCRLATARLWVRYLHVTQHLLL